MRSRKIKLVTIADVRDFVSINTMSEVDITLTSGRYVVDGKSILGIFSLDLMNPITISVDTDGAEADAYFDSISRFIVEE